MTDEEIRQAYDILMGDGNGAAWQTRVQTDIDPRTGVGVHTRPYEYSPQELQAAMTAGDEDNPWRAGLFNYILQNTGNPRMAVTGTNLAEYAPLLGTALAAKDAEIAARDIPDAWREGNTADLLGNIAQIGLSGADMALTMAPFAKSIWKGGRNVARNMGRRGPVPTMYSNPLAGKVDDAASPAQEVARLLREGRANEVTDDMLAKFTPNDEMELFDLYQRGKTGVDMPMDEASRIARAQEMGFDTDKLMYHGTDAGEISSFNPAKGGENLPATFLTDSRRVARTYGDNVGEYFARSDYPADFYFDGRSTTKFDDETLTPGGLVRRIKEVRDDAARYGAETETDLAFDLQSAGVDPMYADEIDSVKMMDVVDDFGWGGSPANNIAVFDPSNIRLRSARFDPRLKHLSNLSAGIGGLGVLGLLPMQPDRAQTEQDTRQYLKGLLQ